MSLRLKRTVLFFCAFYLGLGGCLGNLAMAKDLFTIFLGGIYKQAERNLYGFVRDIKGDGLKDVGIYDQGKLLAVTSEYNGFFHAKVLSGEPYNITAKKDGYHFLPQWIEIPANEWDKDNVNFTGYSNPSPGPVTLLSPSGTTYSSTPMYKWIAPSYAPRFKLLVEDSTGADKIDKVYTESEAGCASGSANCSVTPSTSLADGSWRWSVQACTSDLKVCGPWSNTMGFIVSAGLPVAPSLISPTGTIYISTPTYKWFSVPNATSYGLLVDDSTGRGKIYKYYTDSEADCASGTCSLTPSTSLADGNATWWVVACNQYYGETGACGPWSNAMGFVVNTGVDDPDIVGLWNSKDKYGEKFSFRIERQTAGGYEYVGKLETLSPLLKNLGFKVGEVNNKFNKDKPGQFSGQELWRDSNGNSWWQSITVWIEGDDMLNSKKEVIATRG